MADKASEVLNALNYEHIIGTPINAIYKAASQNAADYIDFIKTTLDENGKPISVTFTKTIKDSQGVDRDVEVTVPMLAIVEHPAMNIVNAVVELNVEVSDSFTQDINASLEAETEMKAGWGPFSISVRAKVSASYAQSRKTDTRAKHHIRVEMEQKGAPETMMRVIDFLTDDIGAVGNNRSAEALPAPAA